MAYVLTFVHFLFFPTHSLFVHTGESASGVADGLHDDDDVAEADLPTFPPLNLK